MNKGLEALNYLYNDLRLMKCLGVVEEAKVKSAYECLKQALLKAQEQEKALEIIKKHFIIKLEEETDLNGNVWGRLVSIQSKEDEGTWDTTACANIVNCKEDFDLLEKVLEEWVKD